MEQRIITARDNYIEFDQWIQENGCKKILMVCDGSIWYMDGFNKHLEEVEKIGVEMIGFRDFQPNPLYASVIKGVELFVHILHFVHHSAAALVINFTGFRQANAAGTAVEQLHLQLIFQFGHRLADG